MVWVLPFFRYLFRNCVESTRSYHRSTRWRPVIVPESSSFPSVELQLKQATARMLAGKAPQRRHLSGKGGQRQTAHSVRLSSLPARESGKHRSAHDDCGRQMQFFRVIIDILQEHEHDLTDGHSIVTAVDAPVALYGYRDSRCGIQ